MTTRDVRVSTTRLSTDRLEATSRITRSPRSDGAADAARAEDHEVLGGIREAHLFVGDAAGLHRILRRGVNLCVWRRRLDAALTSWLDGARAAPPFSVVASVDPGHPDVDRLVAPLPSSPERALLRHDVAALVARYAAVVPCRAVKAELALLTRDTCRKLHVDHIGVRLLCTYAGPGTQWVPNDTVRRRHLCRDDMPLDAVNAAIAGRLDEIRSLRALDVALLKGGAWPGNEDNGVVHRSPPIAAAGERRLVLTLDHVA